MAEVKQGPGTLDNLWLEFKAEAETVVTKLEGEAAADLKKIVPVVESDLAYVGSQIKTVLFSTAASMLTTEFETLTGAEKQGNVVTAGIQEAEKQGLKLGVEDATMFAQQAFRALGVTVPASLA